MSPYTARLVEISQKMTTSQDEVLDRVAEVCADALEGGNLIHLFGSGHSVTATSGECPPTTPTEHHRPARGSISPAGRGSIFGRC